MNLYKDPISLSKESKIKLYQDGEYIMTTPPVIHASWTVINWIDYIGDEGFIAFEFLKRNPPDLPIQRGEFYKFVAENIGTIHDSVLLEEYLAKHIHAIDIKFLPNQTVKMAETITGFRYWELDPEPKTSNPHFDYKFPSKQPKP